MCTRFEILLFLGLHESQFVERLSGDNQGIFGGNWALCGINLRKEKQVIKDQWLPTDAPGDHKFFPEISSSAPNLNAYF